MEKSKLLGGEATQVHLIPGLRHDVVHRAHGAPYKCEYADSPQVPGCVCNILVFQFGHVCLLLFLRASVPPRSYNGGFKHPYCSRFGVHFDVNAQWNRELFVDVANHAAAERWDTQRTDMFGEHLFHRE